MGIWYSHELLSLSHEGWGSTLRSCLLTLFLLHLLVLGMKEAPPTHLLALPQTPSSAPPLLPPSSPAAMWPPVLGTAEQWLIWIRMLIRNERIERKALSQG